MVNRGDAIGWGEWRNLPIEKQMGWRVPVERMIDLPHLRKTHSVMLVSEYLRLHNIDVKTEWSNGAWHRTDYHQTVPPTSLSVIPNNEFDPAMVVRVDNLKHLPHVARTPADSKVHDKLIMALGTNTALDYSAARSALMGGMLRIDTDEQLEKVLAENGWATLYTYAGAYVLLRLSHTSMG